MDKVSVGLAVSAIGVYGAAAWADHKIGHNIRPAANQPGYHVVLHGSFAGTVASSVHVAPGYLEPIPYRPVDPRPDPPEQVPFN